MPFDFAEFTDTKESPPTGGFDFSEFMDFGTQKADERNAPVSVGDELTGMTLPAHGPFDFAEFMSQPDSRLVRTAPSGPLAASSTGVTPSIPPRGDTISEGPGIDYKDKIGARPDSWLNQPQEDVTGVGPLTRNLGREVVGLVKGIGKQIVDLAAASGPIANPAAAKAVADDLEGMVQASIEAIHNAGTATGTNPFAGGLNPIIEHAKVWFNQDLSEESARLKHAEIDRKYPAYAQARDAVDKNLLGTALGIVGIVEPFRGAMVPKPLDLVKQVRAGELGPVESQPLSSMSRQTEGPTASPADVSRGTLQPTFPEPQRVTPVSPLIPDAGKMAEPSLVTGKPGEAITRDVSVTSTGKPKPPRPTIPIDASKRVQEQQSRAQQAWDQKYGSKGKRDMVTWKIAPKSVAREILAMVDEATSEAGPSLQSRGGRTAGHTEYYRIGSAKPKWVQDSGLSYEKLQEVIQKVLKGEPITQRQSDALAGVYGGAKQDYIARHGGSGMGLSVQREGMKAMRAADAEAARPKIAGDLKEGQQVRVGDEWLDVKEQPNGMILLEDGVTIELDVFDKIPGEVKQAGKDTPRFEPTPAGDQGLLGGMEQRQVPTEPIRNVGRSVKTVQNQGDVFQPDKIKYGNLPQDQASLFGKPVAGAGVGPSPLPPAEPPRPAKGGAVGEPGLSQAGSRPLPVKMEAPSVKEPVTAASIAETIQKDFGITIRTGNFRNRALGIFKVKPEVIRTGEANALSTISHELGHYLDKKILGGLKGQNRQRFRQWNDELMAMGKAIYGNRKPSAGYRAEGFAEYVREWLTTGEAAAKAPEFHKFFEGNFLGSNPDIATKLARVREMVTDYRDQGALARHRGRIDYGGKYEETTLREKMSSGWRAAVRMFSDDLFPLEQAQKKLLAAAGKPETWFHDIKRPDLSPIEVARAVSKTAHSTASMFIKSGTFDFAGNKTGPGLVEILKPFNPAETLEVFDYTIARRLVEASKRGKKIPKEWVDDAQYVIDNQSASKDSGKPNYEEAAKSLTSFSDRVLDYYVDAGGLTPEGAAQFRESNAIYISLRRAFKESETGRVGGSGGAGFANRGTPGALKRFKGSGRPVADPIESYVKTIEQLVGAADKTRVARLLVELAEGTEGHGVLMDRIPAPMRADTFTLERIAKTLKDEGIDLQGADLDAALTLWSNSPVYFGKDPVVAFVRNGKREFWEVFDKDLYRSLLSMDKYQLPPFLNWVLGKPARAVRLGSTGLKAGFSLITNPLRDIQTFVLQTSLNLSQAARAMRAIVTDPEVRARYARSNVSMSQPLGLDWRTLDMAVSEVLNGKRTLTEVVKHPIEIMREALSVTESGPRLLEYAGVEAQYPKGSAAGRIAAINAASDVTVNFRRMGTMGAVLNQIIPFFNPAIQGTAKMARLARTNPKKAGLLAVTTLTVPSLALWWQNKDEPWYKSLPDWQKYGFWNFKVGEKIMRLPRPFEWGYFFAALPEAAADVAYRKDPSQFKGFAVQLAKSMNPADLPAAVAPIVEVAANHDFFKGKNIVPFFMDRNNFAEEEYFPWTPELVKKAGAALGVSPLKIEHLLSGYTGGLAKDVLYATEDIMRLAGARPDTTMQAADWPVVGRVFGREFNLENEWEQAEQQFKLLELRYNNKIEALEAAGKYNEANAVLAEALAALETERMRTSRRLTKGR